MLHHQLSVFCFSLNVTAITIIFNNLYLGKPVQWEPIEKNVGEEFNDTEDREDNPVHQPLGVIISGW